MYVQHDTTAFVGHFLVTPPARSNGFMIVHGEVPLGQLPVDSLQNRFLLIEDDDRRITGLVLCEEIVRRLHVSNEAERTRWSRMPVATLQAVVFPAVSQVCTQPFAPLTACTAITENDALIGIITEGDIFLSWEWLLPVISGASCDPLTRLMNRGAYERRLTEEWNRALRMGWSVGVIFADLDHFKEINDGYGHAAGDAVLRTVASRLERSLRSYDIVARYGGDEFVAICLGCQPDEIVIPLRRIVHELRRGSVIDEHGTIDVSASLGAAVRHDGFERSSPWDLMAAADKCLYEAKHTSDGLVYTEFSSRFQDGTRRSTSGASDYGARDHVGTDDATI